MTNQEAILKFLKGIKAGLIKDQQTKNIRASGQSADSLRETATNTKGQLFGAGYFTQQFLGRRPGKFPPIEAIQQWMQTKGIVPVDISERSLAFLIARKIAKSGTDIYQGKRPALALDEIVEQNKPQLFTDMKEAAKAKFRSQLFETLRSVTA